MDDLDPRLLEWIESCAEQDRAAALQRLPEVLERLRWIAEAEERGARRSAALERLERALRGLGWDGVE